MDGWMDGAKKVRKLKRERKMLEKEKLKNSNNSKVYRRSRKQIEKAAKVSKKNLKELQKLKQKKSEETSYSESDCFMKDVNDDSDIRDRFDSSVCYKCVENDNMSGWIGC